MQYYLNGFRPGDPTDFRVAEDSAPRIVELPESVDVLIIGCGPAGLLLAAQLAQFPDIRTRIIERKLGPMNMGQADGVSGRSLEIFQAFGFVERVLKEAYFLEAITFWQADKTEPERIVRTTKKKDGRGVFSEFPHVVLNQARVHRFLLDVMQKSAGQLVPDYGRRLVNLEFGGRSKSRNGDALVTATVEGTAAANEGREERVTARYIVGCDGARSTVRQLLGLPMRGDSANKAWGVMDLLLATDFPDIRIKSIVQSANEGNLLIIPREGGHLVRFYVEMDQLKESERVSALDITVDQLIAASQRILSPYTLDVKEVVWWSVYEIGQRLCDALDNGSMQDVETPNVFIVGDACHTHSPKAGQGMNVSIHDSFNLGWKLASVVRGQTSPEILRTYSDERRAIAQELLAFDRELATMFSAPEDASGDGPEPTRLQRYMVRHDGYVSGTLTQYRSSEISAEPHHQALAGGIEVGKRMYSSRVVRLADGRPIRLGQVLEADGRWRIIAFANSADPANPSSPVWKLADFLQHNDESPIRRYTPADGDIDTVIELLVVFQQGYRELDVQAIPAFLSPEKGIHDLRDYEKTFCPDLDQGDDIFEDRNIDRDSGCLVVVRPDQHVANILPLDGVKELAEFFARFMRPRA